MLAHHYQYSAYHKQKKIELREIAVRVATCVNTLRPRKNGRHFADDIFKCIFFDENVWIPIKISLKFVPHGPINNIPALVQIMAWRRPGDKPLSGPMMVRLPRHICVTRPQWVNVICLARSCGMFKNWIPGPHCPFKRNWGVHHKWTGVCVCVCVCVKMF